LDIGVLILTFIPSLYLTVFLIITVQAKQVKPFPCKISHLLAVPRSLLTFGGIEYSLLHFLLDTLVNNEIQDTKQHVEAVEI